MILQTYFRLKRVTIPRKVVLLTSLNLQQSWPTLPHVENPRCQLTGSSNISKIIPRIIKIPTANLRHSTMTNSQKVYLGDYNNERQSKTAAETGNTYISETMRGTVNILTTNLRFMTMHGWKILLECE